MTIYPADTADVEILPDPDLTLIGPDSYRQPSIAAGEPVDGLAVMLIGPDPTGHRLVFVNEGLSLLVGRRPDELVGRPPTVLFTADEGSRHLPAISDMVTAWSAGSGRSTGVGGLEGGRTAPDLLDLLTDPRLTGSPHPGAPRSDGPDSAGDTPQVTWSADPDHFAELIEGGQPTVQFRSDSGESPTDLPAGGPDYQASTILVTGDDDKMPAFLTAQALPSPTDRHAYVVVQFRDLRRAAAERLLADQETVVASLKRGHHLGQLCHQIAVMIEHALSADATCWVSITNPDGRLEPVIDGGFSTDLVAATTAAISRSSRRQTKRIASVAGLEPEVEEPLRGEGIANLWYVPVLGASSVSLRGAIVIATGDATPDAEATKLLDHLAQVLSVAVDHASVESDTAYQALHDPLTRLPNRALIVDRISQAMARLERDGTSLSVLLVDIDRFKTVNDIRGVDVGDQVLIEVADRLLAAVRLGDTVGRISSDQYLVMCVATNGELDAAAVARRILRSLAEPIALRQGDDLHITASIGAVVVTDGESERSPAEVISSAESALATATSVGRGQFAMFEVERQDDVVRRHQTEQALRHGIANDELVLHYQPLVEIKSGVMIGAEALVRWDRPDHGMVPPNHFIPVAEDTGLIVDVDEWVINTACADLTRWPRVKGRLALISINLSARHLEVDTLVPTVIRALQRNDLRPNRVGFEITETMAVVDTEAALANLEKLAGLGCRIAIDDFGIGHASLDYLRRFSMATAIKIDRSFVAGLMDSAEDAAIVKASIGMADALDLHVVAEGVETVEQLLALRELGCRYAQGHVLSRALPLDIVLEIWNRSRLYSPM